MKAWKFVTFLTLLVLTHSCEEFWNSWQTYPCRDTTPLSTVLLCFRTKDNSSEFIMNNSNLTYNCKGGAPDVRLLPCLNVTEMSVLTLIECHLTDFEMTNFTFDVPIAVIEISYTTERLNFEGMTLRGVPSFQKLILNGLRTDGSLQLILEDLPCLALCQITNHNFTSFTRRPFQRLTNLQILRIIYGILEDLPEDLFYGMVNLRHLLLKDNRIKKIPPLLFRNLWRLVDLDISGNRIGELTEDLFFNLSNLKTLHIGSNKLKVLPENLLRYVPSLYIFDIVGNTEITSLPKALLKGQTYLETFNAFNCSIVYLDESFFSHSQRLKTVSLINNHLKHIPSGLFNNTKNLRNLMLGLNMLTSLSPAVFYHLSRLEVLQLSFNNLQQLPKDIFKRMSSLSKLDLAGNNLQYIHQDTFLPLINLKEVRLRYNNITNLPERNPFGTSRYLNVLLLNNSGLKAFPNIDWSNHNLTLVDLSHNKIREVTLPVFTKNRTEILLNGNNISTIYIDYQQRSNNSPVYNVRGNVIECDCRIRQFLHFLHTDQRAVNIFPDSNTVECNGDSEKKLMEIWPIYGVCPRKKECPLFCDCYLTLEEQTVVDCSRRNLSDPPANLPTNATFVYLNDNRIANLSEVDGVTWQNVTHLYLSNNSLTSLNDWIIPEYLSFLTLDGNRLSELPSSLMTHVDNLSNFSIFLSRNEWKCDCHSVRFKKWFTRNLLKIRDSENVTCDRSTRSNNSVQKSLISHVPLDLFCIKETRMEKWHIAVIITCLLCSSVLLAFVAISHYRYKTTILAFLYSRKIYCPCWDAVEDGEDRKYDAFICYNSADRDTMLEMMEQLEPTYSLCVHERDWLPGLPISQHIVYSVQNSRKTVILLSRNFLESIWFKVEFRAAYNQMIHDQAHRLMLVVMGDLGDVSELEKDLRHLLTTKTYLKWGEKWFWEKLKYALHYRKKYDNMDIGRLQLIVTFISAAVYLQSDDISGAVFDPAYFRKIQCAKGVNLLISDDTKSVTVICNETQFDVSLLRECSGYSQFKEIAFVNCILPSSDIGETLGDYRPEGFFVHSNGSWNYDEIIVRDIPTLTCLALSIKQNVTYVLDNLCDLSQRRYFEVCRKSLYLYLCCNRLEELPELLFEGLGSLISIDLSLNRLTSLPANIFKGLINLRNLFLGSNRFKQFPPTLLHDNINLQIIDITNNTVSSVPEDFLKASFRLVVFEACYCNITELPDNFFSSSFLLSVISLCYNKIEKLGENLFSNNTWLRILYLNNNRLTSLPANIFASNHRLTGLLLHGNRLNSFANETFRKLSSLQTLTLGENEITNIEEGVFGNLQSLKVINLDNNKIRFLPSKTPLGNLSELLNLSLAGNELTTFPSIDWSVYNLSYLYLDYNRITFLDLDELPPSDHVYVSLLYNNITSVTGPTNSTSLENVKLEGNPFECNCSLKNFADKIRSSGIKSLFCHGPAEYRNTSLADVVPSYVLCPFRTTCPNSCRCYREDTNAIVNCSSSGLIHVPESIPENTSVVRLDHNFVTQFHISSDDWSNVTYLNLDYNRLDPSKSWKIPTSLTYLSLRSNQLDRISKEFLESVDEMPLLRLDIRDNRFWCNCSFAYFKIWFDKNIDRIVEADRVMCSRLYQHNNTKVKSPIISVPLDAFCFLDLPLVNVPLIVSASIVAILALAIISCIVLFMKYKNTVLAYLYVHFPAVFCRKISEIDGDKLYDAFVSYTASDREVVMSMLRELEEKPPFFRLCIHERDWLPGNPIVSQIEASIQNSRKTVIVLSKEFLESMWCEIEFQMAYLQCLEEKVDRLVIVMVGDKQTRDLLPADMQNLLATKTFLVWGEKWFWEKLKYSLPHYVLPKLPNYQMQTIDRMV
ncbi:uncharacterized protein [Centruroides vittatus]|uniref:uncharacterized protein n=1 Tax=Centruroides vittatus TaxID=120091 RepID=UPI0035103169